ncbi:hypothetical protein BOTBODRAFT_39649 [Botryobasidium botryosum FD-172 SS1]|uniref:Uncharacterized protein n=1 Tax=Botryobasidium botryosum (strain FD-172 SS1) TaxID=930990 RepID=A0A067LTI6_BOTB1|nr:hypothetical protein BOTBODRAFT_39649 [Botryobasidium botryosum FD-172 SS1]
MHGSDIPSPRLRTISTSSSSSVSVGVPSWTSDPISQTLTPLRRTLTTRQVPASPSAPARKFGSLSSLEPRSSQHRQKPTEFGLYDDSSPPMTAMSLTFPTPPALKPDLLVKMMARSTPTGGHTLSLAVGSHFGT